MQAPSALIGWGLPGQRLSSQHNPAYEYDDNDAKTYGSCRGYAELSHRESDQDIKQRYIVEHSYVASPTFDLPAIGNPPSNIGVKA
jgi:hypothetical protein